MWILVLLLAPAWAEDVIVTTGKGTVVGQTTSDGYKTFFGVPYAKVDEGNPFGNSLNQPAFKKPFIANDSTILCPQATVFVGGILQCLTLNIYVPNQAGPSNTKAVFVWFYGGGFFFGYAGQYGGQYLVQQDIVVITVNYRLGPYGFLCLNDPKVPGNQGLKDQIAALRWIKANIGAFGGDPTKITIAGESYGGGSVDFHLYSMYEKLFDKTIVQSGSIFTPYVFGKGDPNAAIELAGKMGHESMNNDDAIKYLARADPVEVMKFARNLTNILRPCKEKPFKGVSSFMTTDPYHFQNSAKIRNAKILIGYNSKETFDTFVDKDDAFYNGLQNAFSERLGQIFTIKKEELETLAKIVRDFYLGGKPIAKESRLELSDFLSDFMVNHAAERSVNNYVKFGAEKVYKYIFSYIGGSPYKSLSGVGAFHTEELQYLFQMTQNLTSDEQIMMRNRMTEMWANFAKYGDPTPQVTSLLPVRWTPVTNTEARPYMNIDVNMEVKNYVNQQRMAFWDLIWNQYWKTSPAI
ncbi:esterase E4 [Manduca sexta]|uniref:esterase E4 n=1 Tax=Manduca sexta TaxID=7130 RepID=UPI00188F7245|nr:esterase E4 [Manduca sexta]